jgi:hypothetical protein
LWAGAAAAVTLSERAKFTRILEPQHC